MDYASFHTRPFNIKEDLKMDIMIKLFLFAYLLAMVLLTTLSVTWILTVVFSPEWITGKSSGSNDYKRRVLT
jgi:hypothetical protein